MNNNESEMKTLIDNHGANMITAFNRIEKKMDRIIQLLEEAASVTSSKLKADSDLVKKMLEATQQN